MQEEVCLADRVRSGGALFLILWTVQICDAWAETSAQIESPSEEKESLSQTTQDGVSSERAQSKTEQTDDQPWRFAPLPSFGYNLERGLGGGAYLTLFRKKELDPEEKGVSYDISLNVGLFWTTRGYQNHKILLDLPYLNRFGLRFQTLVGYERQSDGWYSGIGEPAALNADLANSGRYLNELKSLWAMSTFTQPLKWFHPHLRTALTWILRQAEIEQAPDKLLQIEAPEGAEGGRFSSLQLSLSWDSRDREPDTRSGVWLETSARFAHPALLSDWVAWGVNLTYRHYVPLSDLMKLTYAHRLGVDWQRGTPYFQRGVMGGAQWAELGGNSVLRGYKFGRFRGESSLYSSHEIRARIFRIHFKKRPIDFLLAPLIDLGVIRGERSKRALGLPPDPHWIWGCAGLGGRLVYDEGFVVRADFVWAIERYEGTKNGQFQNKAQLGIFAMTGHSF